MSLPLLLSERARADVPDLSDYIAKDSPEAAGRFLEAGAETLERIEQWPLSGRQLARPEMRTVPIHGFPRYLVIWWVAEDHVEILRVFQARADRDRILRTIRP